MTRTFVIGDIHGALKALQQLIGKLKLKAGDRLIFLGDYVDGWPESAGVISYLMELDEQYNCLFIRGNHDAWCEGWLRGGLPDEVWLYNGGASTVKSYQSLSVIEKQLHRSFFEKLINYYVDEHNRLFVHAGFSSMHGPSREPYMTNYSWDRTLWEMALVMNKRIKKDSRLYPKRLLLFNEIYIGHTPTTNYDESKPMNAVNVWNVDTGAGFRGRISALNIDTKSFMQSDPTPDFYPGEKGRNRD